MTHYPDPYGDPYNDPCDEESSRCNGDEVEDMAGVGLVGGTSPVVVVDVVVAAAHGRVEYSENSH